MSISCHWAKSRSGERGGGGERGQGDATFSFCMLYNDFLSKAQKEGKRSARRAGRGGGGWGAEGGGETFSVCVSYNDFLQKAQGERGKLSRSVIGVKRSEGSREGPFPFGGEKKRYDSGGKNGLFTIWEFIHVFLFFLFIVVVLLFS